MNAEAETRNPDTASARARPVVYHYRPRFDLIDHEFESCPCGPTLTADGRGGVIYVHHALDGR